MIDELPGVAVVFDAPAVVPVRRARWYHYVGAWLWNLYRKPLVWKRQREILSIFHAVKSSMDQTLLPALYERRTSCESCCNAYLSLKPQVFLSSIEKILRRMQCEDHPQLFHTFLSTWETEFKRSERLSAWINGFSSC
jgi:hypothetical protein